MDRKARTKSLRLWASIGIGFGIALLSGTAAMFCCLRSGSRQHQLARSTLTLSNAYSDAGIRFPLSDAKLKELLQKYRLKWPASTSDLLHFWRLWAIVDDNSKTSILESPLVGTTVVCAQVRSLFLNDSTFRACYPTDKAWFERRTEGLSVRPKTGFASSTGERHPGQFLSILAECGILNDEVVTTSDGQFTVRDVVLQAEHDYLVGDSAEFVAVGFAFYLPPERGFTNKLNDFITFDALMQSLTESPLGEGSCHGAHICYAVAVILSINEKVPILSESAVQRGKDYLARIAKLLTATQHPDGAWRVDWSEGERWRAPASVSSFWGDDILVTGHHLEWLAIAPRRLLPSDSIQRAIGFLACRLQAAESKEILGSYCPWSHAIRSLLLWHTIVGKEPLKLPLVRRRLHLEGYHVA